MNLMFMPFSRQALIILKTDLHKTEYISLHYKMNFIKLISLKKKLNNHFGIIINNISKIIKSF